MKLIIEQAALQKALARVTGVVAARNTIPVLANVVIDASAAGEVWLIATDLDIEARARVEAKIDEPGAITAPAGLLGDLVRSAPSGAEISLVHGPEDPRLTVRFGKSRYQVPVLPRDLFPTLPPLEGATPVVVQAVDLKGMFARVAFAQSAEQIRQYLCGVYLHVAGGEDEPRRLRVVATDTHRMAMADAPADEALPRDIGVILPSKAVAEFQKALDSRAGPVTLSLSRAAAVLDLGDAVIRTKVIEGAYIEYWRVIPKDWEREIRLDRAVFADIVKRVNLIADQKSRAVVLAFDEDRLSLRASNLEAGQGVEELDVHYDGDPFELGFNARYLIDALNQTDADAVVLRVNDVAGPCRLEPAPDDAEHGPVLAIVVPQRA